MVCNPPVAAYSIVPLHVLPGAIAEVLVEVGTDVLIVPLLFRIVSHFSF